MSKTIRYPLLGNNFFISRVTLHFMSDSGCALKSLESLRRLQLFKTSIKLEKVL